MDKFDELYDAWKLGNNESYPDHEELEETVLDGILVKESDLAEFNEVVYKMLTNFDLSFVQREEDEEQNDYRLFGKSENLDLFDNLIKFIISFYGAKNVK